MERVHLIGTLVEVLVVVCRCLDEDRVFDGEPSHLLFLRFGLLRVLNSFKEEGLLLDDVRLGYGEACLLYTSDAADE